jgi:hypothetical protein
MAGRRRLFLIAAMLVLAVFLVPEHSDAKFWANPVDCYALLVVAANDTNATIQLNLDPIDVNASLVALARIYGALKEAGYEDSKILVLYCSGGLQPDWSEKKKAKYIKMLRTRHFKRQNMDATKGNIQTIMNAIKQKLDENDQFVFWINTHGAANGMLMMARRGKWSTGEIQNTFTGLKSRTNYLLFDSCFSGQILDRCNIDNAVMFSTTQSNSPGWVDRLFTNCATFIECKINKKCDKDKDGIVDYEEAFNATMENARKYKPKLDEYIRTRYKPNKPAPPGITQRSSIIPKFTVGGKFVVAKLGPHKSGDKAAAAKPKKRKRKKKDPGAALMKKAALYEQGKDWVTVIEIYQKVSKMGARSKFAEEAAEKIEKLLAKKDVKEEYDKHLKKKQLEEDYAMAESFALARHYEDVIEYCEKVMKDAPGSSMAKKAKILLGWTKDMQRLEGAKKKEEDK